MVAPKDPGYRASLRGSRSLLDDTLGRALVVPPLSQAEEFACATEYVRARTELLLATLESPVAVQSFLQISADSDAGDPDDNVISYFYQAADASLVADVRRALERLHDERQTASGEGPKKPRSPGAFGNESHGFWVGSRRALERIGPTDAFVDQVLARQREVIAELVREQRLARRLATDLGLPLGDVQEWVRASETGWDATHPLSKAVGLVREVDCVLEQLRTERRAVGQYALALGFNLEEVERSHARAESARRRRDSARDRMVRHNLRLVVWVAKRYIGRGMPLSDLVQEGNFGLLRAVDKYDPQKGFRFSTYAMWWIRQAVQRGLAEKVRTIRLPVHMHEFRRSIEQTRRELRQSLGREPSREELARAAGVPVRKIERIQKVEGEPSSLEAPLRGGDAPGFSLAQLVADDEATSAVEAVIGTQMTERLAVLMRVLSERERRVLRRRFGLSGEPQQTLQQIAVELGVTRERVRQIQAKAMDKLGRAARRRGLAFDDF